MKHFQKYIPFALALPLLGVPNSGLVPPVAAQDTVNTPKGDLQIQGDKAYEQKSYARALELYRAAKNAGTARSNEMLDYKIIQSLYKTEKWDEAIATANASLKTAQWKARLYYVLAQIYVKAPKTAWKIGDKTIRQDEYPEVADGVTPERIYLADSDQKAALDNFEEAKIAAQKERDIAMRSRFSVPIYPLTAEEEADLNFDLAAYLPQVGFQPFTDSLENRTDGKFDDVIDLAQPYAKGWSLPKKVLYLYAEIRKIDQSKAKADFQRSLLGEGLFIRAYRQRMDGWASKYDDVKKEYIKRPYPFDSSEPIPVWRRLVKEFPKSDLAPNALMFIAQSYGSDYVKAMPVYRELVAKYPKSKWVSDAKSAIAQIEAKEVNFSLSSPTRPNEKPKLNVNSRNVASIDFVAYRVKLENFLTPQARLKDPNTLFTSWTQNFGKIEEAARKFGDPIAKWNYKTGAKGDYQSNSGEITAPFSDIGAYAVVATGGERKFAQIIVISDLALLKKSDKNGSFVYVANAKTGEAVNGANVVLKEVWSYNPRKVDVLQGKSNDAGFFDKKRAADNNPQVSAFAYVGNRYALTGTQGGYWYGYAQRAESRALGYTDRPVYRPNQNVNFRFMVTERAEGGDWKPVVGKEFTVRANNPKGEEVFNTKLKTNEFGSLNGEITLKADAALGVFNLSVSDNQRTSGSASFRVEEYKRPEFEVTVTAPLDVKRPGETVAARINAKYYFGAPVPNAKVKYTVRKSTWWASYSFPSRYDWLYNSWGVNQNRRNIGGEGSGEIVKEGEVTTDEKGFAELSFQTHALENIDENNWWARYSNPLYTIEAEVTDASRRTIEAQGSVKVARQPYFAFLNVERGYFQKGDRVPVEIRTQDANGQTVAATGTMRVYKLLSGNKEERVFESTVTTDANGKAFWTWPSVDSGQFRIEFEGQGEWGEKVKAQTQVWVVGENMSAIRLQGVTILLDKRDYQEGDTLKAVIVADKLGAKVLLTQEASGQILRRDIVEIDAQSKTIEIPIQKQHVPNFFLAAALIQDFEVYQAQTEVFVPPVRSLLDLKVKGDKAEYKPGEKGIFEIEARDWSGKPARAEVSLALIDASLFYIQGDQTPDLRQYYYGERRANTVNLDSSRSGNQEARGEGPDLPRYETHNFELPDDFGQLQLMPGGFGYYPRLTFAPSVVMRTGYANSVDSAMPMMAAPAPVAELARKNNLSAPSDMPMTGRLFKEAAEAQASPQAVDAQPRTNFAETAYWSPAIITEGGKAKVEVTFPDSLTQWHATARGLTNTVQVAAAETDVVTKKDLLVRLQAPRFFVERDQVTISANVHNYSDKAQTINVGIDVSGDVQRVVEAAVPSTITLAAGAEKRVDWTLKAIAEGTASIQVSAKTATDSDAVKMSFPVFVHGAPVFAGQSGKIEADGTTKLTLNFPKERQFGASQLNLQLNPSLAATMLDALPYLVDYPYGCVEQTTSRFVPTILVEKTLKDSGINLATLRQRAASYEAESKTANVGERVKNTGYTFPKGQPNSRDLEKMASNLWFTGGRGKNPVFDGGKVRDMTNDGLKRLADMQRSDGGWGWFSGAPESDEYMSAYVVYALSIAKNAGVAVPDKVLNGGRNYLNRQMKDEDNLHLLTYIAYALAQTEALSADSKAIATGRLFEQRERLSTISKAYLAMTLNNIGEAAKAKILVENLENTISVDATNGTARWKTGNQYWYWWNNDVETVAVGLRAFLQINPQNKLAPMLVKWLTLQSRGNKWRSTKETAEVVYTLAQWVQVNRELDVDYTLKVSLNDKMTRTYRVTSDNALFFDNRFLSGDLFLNDGNNTLTIEKKGKGVVYYNAYSEYFSKEESIKGSGNELEVTRRFFKLTRKAETAVPTLKDIPIVSGLRPIRPRPIPAKPNEPEYDRAEIKDGAMLKSGDLVEVELVLNAKNDYSYLVFEDMKAAGMETVDIRSGYDYSDSLSYYMELRDEKAAFFITNLPQGRRVLRYRLRAEIPGTFHALPTNGYAMYAPEVRGTSDEIRVSIAD
jgi:uncharacterized protein YfaS (alpha-2-macroglobulin family)